jgi:hypothetical protein
MNKQKESFLHFVYRIFAGNIGDWTNIRRFIYMLSLSGLSTVILIIIHPFLMILMLPEFVLISLWLAWKISEGDL